MAPAGDGHRMDAAALAGLAGLTVLWWLALVAPMLLGSAVVSAVAVRQARAAG
jgi:hypothetical protein